MITREAAGYSVCPTTSKRLIGYIWLVLEKTDRPDLSLFLTRYLVPGARYLVPGSWYLVPGAWYQVAGTRCWVQGTWYQVPGTRYQQVQAPGTRHLVPGTLP